MPDLVIPGSTDIPDEPKPKEEGSKIEQPSAGPTKEVTELQAKYQELEKIASTAIKRAEGAESFVGQLTASLQEAAARHGTQRSDLAEQPDMREALAENPAAFLDRHFAERAGPIVQSVTENQARLNREVAFSKFSQEKIEGTDKSLLDLYGAEVDQFMANMPADTRAQADSYESAMGWVRARHVNDEVKLRYEGKIEHEKRAFVEPPAGGGGDRRPTKTLSDIEKAVAKGLGIGEEDYMKYRDAEA